MENGTVRMTSKERQVRAKKLDNNDTVNCLFKTTYITTVIGLDHLQTCLRPGSKPNSITLSWSQTGLRLVADLLARASALLAS